MWVNKNIVMGVFADEVKKGKYKKISYGIWHDLKTLPDEWDLKLEYSFSPKEECRYITISWAGCDNWLYEFEIDDGSLGEYLYNLIETNTISSATSSISNALAKCAETANIIKESWINIADKNLIKSPKVEIAENGQLFIDGKLLEEKIDNTTGVSIRKENDDMNLFKGFDFGSCEKDNVKVSIYGVAVRNASGTWVSYDSKSGNVVDVDVFNFDAKFLYKIPVAIKDIKAGDTIIHCRKPVFVIKNENGKISCIDPASAEEKIVLPVKNIFGFDFAVKIVNLFEGMEGFEAPSADQPFGNNLWMYMMLEDKGSMSDLLPFIWFSNKGNDFNPLMLLALSNDKTSSNDLLPLLLLSQNNIFGQTK